MRADNILLKPIVTEKTSQLVTKNVYTFQVHGKANKHQVAEIVKNLYNVEVGEVKIVNRKGKVKKVGRRMIPQQKPTKKIAYITLTKGSLAVFPKI